MVTRTRLNVMLYVHCQSWVFPYGKDIPVYTTGAYEGMKVQLQAF